MSPETNIIFGPPGTGKTTKLLSIVEQKIRDGLNPSDICYAGFTRRAANEAKERAIKRFGLDPDQFPWFKTLHSLAFGILNLNKNHVMGVGDYIVLCRTLGLSITVGGINNDEGVFAGQTKGDRLFFAEAMSRARMQDLKTYHGTIPDEDLYLYELQQLRDALETYKRVHNKMDFTDIIYAFVDGVDLAAPPCQVLIVDEAQDLSPLQWKMVDKLSDGIGETFIAGDDDQAIFRWAGADVDKLINLPGTRTVLTKSYRVPQKVQEVADRIAQRISVRVEKNWKAREAEGVVEYAAQVDDIEMAEGNWLLLARNSFLLDTYIGKCMQEGFLFDAKSCDFIGKDTSRAIQAWQEVVYGSPITGTQVKIMTGLMGARTGIAHGYKGKIDELRDFDRFDLTTLQQKHGLLRKAGETWDAVLDKIPAQEREYFLAAARRGEELDLPPRIRISTIHGAKGAEADNVVVMQDMAHRTYREMEAAEDDEHRVWYVAVTRARERLIIVQPQSDRSYDI